MMLKNYFDILSGKGRPKHASADMESLIERCKETMEACSLCEHRCGAQRIGSEAGVCGVAEPRIASEFLHHGEERELVPSHTVFFSGCNFNCAYCQNWDISQNPDAGRYIEPGDLADTVAERFSRGARNLNLVGGEPTPNLLYILRVVKRLEVLIPVVWNSNMYLTEEAMSILNRFVDLYLTDFKYGNNRCASRLSCADGYFDAVSRNHALIEGDIIVRHLVLPNHVDCCSKPVLDWIARNLGTDTYVNIMDQYRPCYRAEEHEDISRPLSKAEYMEVVKYGQDLGFAKI